MPASLKIFLLALAIIDDLGAIIIIAFFYTAHLSLAALALAGLGVAALVAAEPRGVTAGLRPMCWSASSSGYAC